MFRSLLFPTDFSPQAEQLSKCVHELKPLGVEEIVLLKVVELGPRGRSAVEDVLLGRVSDAVICRHTKPALVIRPVRVAMPV